MVNSLFETQSVSEDTYIPFQDGIILESQGYYRISKCEYCGKPASPANCHAHREDCPLYCHDENPNELSLNGDIFIFIGLVILYSVVKFIKNIR